MNRFRKLGCYLTLISLLSCQSKHSKVTVRSEVSENKISVSSNRNIDSPDLYRTKNLKRIDSNSDYKENIIRIFFSFLIESYRNENYCCMPIPVKDELGYFHLDTTFFDSLTKYKLGSAEIQKFRDDVESCNTILRKLSSIDEDPSWAYDECRFLGSYRWIGGQGEQIDSFTIKPANKNKCSIYLVTVYTGNAPVSENIVTVDSLPPKGIFIKDIKRR